MKLNAKSILFIGTLLLLFGVTFLSKGVPSLQTSLNDLFSVKVNNTILPKEIVNKYSNNLSIIIEASSFELAKEKADILHTRLLEFGINDIIYSAPKNMLEQGSEYLKKYKNSFLDTDTYKLLLQNKTTDVRQQTVQDIQTSWMPTILPLREDPFLLLTHYVQNMPKPAFSWREKDGVFYQQKNEKFYILMMIHLTQNDMNNFIEQIKFIQSVIQPLSKEVIFHLSGAPIHTVQMFQKSRTEIFIISLLGAFSLLILTYRLFSNIKITLHIIFNLILSFACGCLLIFLFCSQIHILTFAFGASLIGICIDYSYHRFWATKTQNIQNITYSFLTTVCCFVPLLLSSFPLLNQIALFIIGGLIGTFIWIMFICYPQTNIQKDLQLHLCFPKKAKVLFLVIGLFIILFGFKNINFSNSLQSLYQAHPSLIQEEKLSNELNGHSYSHLLLVRGNSLQDTLEKEEKIKESEDFFCLASVLPSINKQKQNHMLIKKLYQSEVKNLKADLHFKFQPTYQQTEIIKEDQFKEIFPSYLNQFVIEADQETWAITPLSKEIVLPNNSDAILFDPTNYLAKELDRYAIKSYQTLGFSLICLLFTLVFIYRKKAIQYLIPSVLSCAETVALLSLTHDITFFHLLSLFVVIGLGIDYTIFLFSPHKTIRPVLFSFLSSFIGFGLLSFVSFTMISIMGKTIALGLLFSFINAFILANNDPENTRKLGKQLLSILPRK